MNNKVLKRVASVILSLALIVGCATTYVTDAAARRKVRQSLRPEDFMQVSMKSGLYYDSVTVEVKAINHDLYYTLNDDKFDGSKKIYENQSMTFTFDEITRLRIQVTGANEEYLNTKTSESIGICDYDYVIWHTDNPMVTVDKESGTYDNKVKVKIKAGKGYRVYYSTGDPYKLTDVVKPGKSKKITFHESTNLYLRVFIEDPDITEHDLNYYSKKNSIFDEKYSYIIEK